MKHFFQYFVIFIFAFIIIHFIKYNNKKPIVDINHNIVITPQVNTPAFTPIKKTEEPEWIVYKPVKPIDNNLQPECLKDVESHLPDGHIYSDNDLITYVHESCHGVNSHIRQKYSTRGMLVSLQDDKPQITYKALDRINAFYVLKDRAIIINEPNITIQQIAKQVPPSLHGDVFDLYLIKQQKEWNNEPLYLLDEAVAYTAGSQCRKELKISSRSETVQYMFEFNVYIITLLKVVKEHDPNYNDKKLKEFIMWQIKRSLSIYNKEENATIHWNKFKNNIDAEELRQFAKKYFGEDYYKTIINEL